MSPPRSTRRNSAPISRRRSGRGQQVGLVAAATDGVDREVLEQQQPIADAPLPPLLGQLVLELPGGLVGDGAEPLDGQLPAVAEEERALVAGRVEGGVAARAARARRLVGGRRRAADVAHLDHGSDRRGAVAAAQPPQGLDHAEVAADV